VQPRVLVVRDVEPLEQRSRYVRLQSERIAAGPELADRLDQANHQRVALDVALLAEEVAQGVFAAPDLVDVRGDIAQLALGADVAEIHGKDLQQVDDLVVDRSDPAVEQARNVLLEEVGVRDQHASDPEVDDQGGNQRAAEFGVAFDQAQVGADGTEMGRVDLDLPVVREAGEARIRELPGEDFVDHHLEELLVPRRLDLETNLRDQVERGSRPDEAAAAQRREGLPYDGFQEQGVCAAKHIQIGVAHFGQGLLVDGCEAIDGQHLDQPVDALQLVLPVRVLRDLDAACGLEVAPFDARVVRQGRQGVGAGRGAASLGLELGECVEAFPQVSVGDGGQRRRYRRIPAGTGTLPPPAHGIRLFEPLAVDLAQRARQQL
jgi:hypothetical protein